MKGNTLLAGVVFSGMCLGPLESFASSAFYLNADSLVTNGAAVALTDEFFGGRTRALKILFTPEALTADDALAGLRPDAKPRPDRHAVLVLFLDKDDKIWQVNLTVVMPGQTVVRTVAWKPDELRRFSSSYSYADKRVRLKTKGTFSEVTTERPPVSLAWEVDVDAPVHLLQRGPR